MPPNNADIAAPPHQISSKLFSVAEIEPWLYLCGASVLGTRLLEELGVTTVVSACPELPPLPLPRSVREHHRVDVRDSLTEDITPHLERVADIVAKTAEEGGKTLIHCVAGVSRSASLCIAYLIKHRGLSLEEAYTKVLSVRPCIRPNQSFFRQLIGYEESLTGRRTVRMEWNEAAKSEIPSVYLPDYLNTLRYINRGAGIK